MSDSEDQPSPAFDAIATLTVAEVDALYQSQSSTYQGRALGASNCLPSTERAQQSMLNAWDVKRDPWMADLLRDDQQLRCLLWVDPGLEYFVGHFPGQPILPGVVQLDWSIHLAAQHWPATAHCLDFTGVQRLKFKQPIAPAALLQLVLIPQPGKIDFVFSSPTEVHSQGTLLYRV